MCVNSEGQLADLLTKGLDGSRFPKLREEIGVSVWVFVLEMRKPCEKRLHSSRSVFIPLVLYVSLL